MNLKDLHGLYKKVNKVKPGDFEPKKGDPGIDGNTPV